MGPRIRFGIGLMVAAALLLSACGRSELDAGFAQGRADGAAQGKHDGYVNGFRHACSAIQDAQPVSAQDAQETFFNFLGALTNLGLSSSCDPAVNPYPQGPTDPSGGPHSQEWLTGYDQGQTQGYEQGKQDGYPKGYARMCDSAESNGVPTGSGCH